MAPRKTDKAALTAALAGHVLAHGLSTASLRPLAKAAGTSDRMLIYHFGSKDGVISAVLKHLSREMAAGLEAALPPGRAESEAALLSQIAGLMRSDAVRPIVRVWLEIVAEAARGSDAHRAAAQEILDFYLGWIAARHPEGAAGAPRLLTLIEGMLVLDAAGQDRIADAVLAQPGGAP